MVALTRRTLLTASATGAALAGTGALTVPARAAGDAILKPLPPEWFVDHGTNAELRWESVRRQDYLTRPARLFVRNHSRTPVIDPATWRLDLHGDGVDAATSLSLADLQALPRTTTTATIECTGNGRSFFGTQQGVRPRAPRGGWVPSAPSPGRESGSARSWSAPASVGTPCRSWPPAWTRATSRAGWTTARCADRSRSPRPSTTPSSPGG